MGGSPMNRGTPRFAWHEFPTHGLAVLGKLWHGFPTHGLLYSTSVGCTRPTSARAKRSFRLQQRIASLGLKSAAPMLVSTRAHGTSASSVEPRAARATKFPRPRTLVHLLTNRNDVPQHEFDRLPRNANGQRPERCP